MPRRFSGILFPLSLTLFVATCGLWLVAACGWGRWFAWQGPDKSYVLAFTPMNLCFQVAAMSPDPERAATYHWQSFSGDVGVMTQGCFSLQDPSIFSRIGLIDTLEQVPYSDGVTNGPNALMATNADSRSFILPWWVLAATFGILPARHAVKLRRKLLQRWRARNGLCAMCGYDLRVTRDRCPECGAVPGPILPVIPKG